MVMPLRKANRSGGKELKTTRTQCEIPCGVFKPTICPLIATLFKQKSLVALLNSSDLVEEVKYCFTVILLTFEDYSKGAFTMLLSV